MRNVKSIIIGLFLAVIILLSAIITISIVYEDEVSKYLVEELNEFILSEIQVDDINFSLLNKFPKASLELKNVVAFTKSGFYKTINGYNTDTLFYAKSIYIQLNLKDIITKNYTITSIHFDQGKMNLFIDRFGDPNYIFWERHPKEEKADFNLELKEVRITSSDILYYNAATNFLTDAYVNKMDFEGNFSKQNYVMKIKSNMLIENMQVNDISYVENKNVKTDLDLDIINNTIQFKNGNVILENLKFLLNGNIERYEDEKVDLVISGKNLSLKSFVNNLPSSIKNEFPAILGQKGQIMLNLNINGTNFRTSRPHINAMFIVNNAQLLEEEKNIQIRNIYIDGEFDNGIDNKAETSKINFKDFYAQIGNNKFKGNFELQNLKNPEINLKTENELHFNEIKNIFNIDTLEILKGNAFANVEYKGKYEELKSFKFSNLFKENYSVNIIIDNGKVKIKGRPIVLSDISGIFDLKRSLYADSLYFKIGENDFLINGRISKLLEYFNNREVFNVNAKIVSRKINLNELALLFKADGTESNKNGSYKFPDKLALQLRLNIQNFEVGKFNATNIKGNLNYKPRMFSLHEISFDSMDGNIKAGGVIIQKYDNNFLVKMQSRLNNMSISNLFYSFNNFGQNFITNKNLAGNLTGDIYFTSEWTDNIKVLKNTVVSDCDIVISEGELNDFDPMLGLSKFIDVEELKEIKFSTLKNKISIENEKIIIPQMEIESSVLKLNASGEHNFDNSYSYHTELLLSDLLSGKVKKSKHKKNTFENLEEDESGKVKLYLLIEGDKQGHKIRYDRKAARVERKKRMRTEREELKKILNEEFGWFDKDSTKKNNDNRFQIDFDENKKKAKTKKNKSNKKFIIEWEEDTTVNQ